MRHPLPQQLQPLPQQLQPCSSLFLLPPIRKAYQFSLFLYDCLIKLSPIGKAFEDAFINWNQGWQLFNRLYIHVSASLLLANIIGCSLLSIILFFATLNSARKLLKRMSNKELISKNPSAYYEVGIVMPAALFKAYNKAICFYLGTVRLIGIKKSNSKIEALPALIIFVPILTSELAVFLQSSSLKCIQNQYFLMFLSLCTSIGTISLYWISMRGYAKHIQCTNCETFNESIQVPLVICSILLGVSQFIFTYREQKNEISTYSQTKHTISKAFAFISGMYKAIVAATSTSAICYTLSLHLPINKLSPKTLNWIIAISFIISAPSQYASLIPRKTSRLASTGSELLSNQDDLEAGETTPRART